MVNILMNNPRVDEVWCRSRLSRYITPGKKVLVIPFSFHPDYIPDNATWHQIYTPGGAEYEEIVRPLEALGITRQEIAFVNYFTDTPQSLGRLIYGADIIQLTGGFPDLMMERLWEFGAISQLSAFPGVLMGYSAGAMVQIDRFHATPEAPDQAFYYCDGLGCITAFDIEVHYTASPVQLAGIRRTLAETHRPVIALEESGGLVLEEGKLIQMGRVHFFRGE